MKIAKIEQFFPRRRMRLVKITTDNGIVGWGETTLEGKPKSTQAAVEELTDYFVGKDPLRIEHHWQHVYRSAFFRGGNVVMHHGILGFKDDGVWDELVGLTGRTIGDGYSHDERLAVHVEEPAHPVTEGISDWTMVDETYDFRDVDREGSEVLLTVDHPNSMSTMAWTRTYKESRVLNFVFGHDAQTWEDETFRRVLGNGVRWVGRQ